MDLFALGLGRAVCQASTAIVYAARCSDPSTLRSLGYSSWSWRLRSGSAPGGSERSVRMRPRYWRRRLRRRYW